MIRFDNGKYFYQRGRYTRCVSPPGETRKTGSPKAPYIPQSSMHVPKGTPVTSHEFDPFQFGPSSSRRVVTSTESRGTPTVTVSTTRPSSSSPPSTVTGTPVIFWNSETKSYTTRNPTRMTVVSTSVTSSTARVSDSGSSSRMNSTIYPSIDALTANLESVSMSGKVTPSVDLASRSGSSSAVPPRTSGNNAAVSSWLQSSPAPSQIHSNGSSARQGLNGAPRDFHKPQSAPAVRVYTPLNSAMPLLSGPESVQNNHFNGNHLASNEPSRGNRGRPFPRGRGRNRGGGNNFNKAGENSGNQGNNGGRHRGRGQHRGNNRGGFNNNHQNQQSDSGSQSVDSVRDTNGSGEDCQSQNPFEIRNHRAEPSETNSETGDVNPRGRGRFFNRGRGRANPRRGQGRRNRGGGVTSTDNNRPEDNASGASVAQGGSGTPTIDLENSPFECPICMEALRAPIYQCHNGHMVCNSCEAQIRQCPICREEMPTRKIRNLPIEQIVTGSA
ncbi:unnamed protein product [Allacma fusca]|uniref:RING-type domain-containing protein n=1 Tax=Allacma fusca TaxID=39272 RepID=A0A8J2LCB1_9HEXA|nr:unnamed protein product [Allacma fusca]